MSGDAKTFLIALMTIAVTVIVLTVAALIYNATKDQPRADVRVKCEVVEIR